MERIEKILAEVLALPREARAALAAQLLKSMMTRDSTTMRSVHGLTRSSDAFRTSTPVAFRPCPGTRPKRSSARSSMPPPRLELHPGADEDLTHAAEVYAAADVELEDK